MTTGQVEEPHLGKELPGMGQRGILGCNNFGKVVPIGQSPANSSLPAQISVPQFPLEKIRKHKYLHSVRACGRVPVSPLFAANPWEVHS